MIGFLLSPVARYIGGAIAILAIIGGIYWKGHSDGSASVERKLAERRAAEIETARQIERDAAACNTDPECLLPDPFRLRVPSVRPDPGK